ncbi:ATP-binding protein [Candidatus Saccharibacteria bacterium]|nr:ATP-binding protein [Candidatus Saccharibacteria bacterium]
MKRKIEQTLLNWKTKSNGRTAILIEGARRTGKSYSVEEFAKQHYRSYILIDFNEAPKEIKELFDNSLTDLDSLFLYISNYYQTKLYERESLIILDEVQLCPRARSAIKYLVANGRYDYIETGSLISIKENVKDILIPSEEQAISMYPMDFEEFLWALGEEQLYDYIKRCFEEKKPMGQLLHRKAMEALRLYEIVGGMPQAVSRYLETKDFEAVDSVKRGILSLYRNDIRKYAGRYAMKVEQIFDDIAPQLQKHDKKFQLSSLEKDARYRTYEDAFLWLDDAKIINTCYNTTAPSIGLRMNLERSSRKLYFSDTGLLLSQAFDTQTITEENIYSKILFDKLSFNSGMVIENLVAQMLRASGHKLFFYSNPSENSEERMEIDFLIQKQRATSRHNISPLEVKSSNNYTLSSIKKFIDKYQDELASPYVIHTSDLQLKEGITYLPLYMTMFL